MSTCTGDVSPNFSIRYPLEHCFVLHVLLSASSLVITVLCYYYASSFKISLLTSSARSVQLKEPLVAGCVGVVGVA